VLPQAAPRAVGTAAIGGDQQATGRRVARPAPVLQPAPNRVRGKLCGVVRNADAHPAAVVGHVIDAVGNRLAEILASKSWTLTRCGRSWRR
jgi:hypothetical protein